MTNFLSIGFFTKIQDPESGKGKIIPSWIGRVHLFELIRDFDGRIPIYCFSSCQAQVLADSCGVSIEGHDQLAGTKERGARF